jgi:hypothetical protein
MRSTIALLLALLAMAVVPAAVLAQPDEGCDDSIGCEDPSDPSEPEEPECEDGTLVVERPATVGEAAGVVVFTVTLGAPEESFACEAALAYQTADGSAVAGADYTPTSGELDFAEDSQQEISVPIIDDALAEGDEGFGLILQPDGAEVEGAADVIIVDDDAPPVLSVAGGQAAEGGIATFTVTLSAPSAVPVSVGYSTTDGSATGGADFAPATGTVTFPPGTTTQLVTVAVPDDRLAEGTEAFGLALSGPQGATIGNAAAQATIADDEAPGGVGGGGGGGGGIGPGPIVPIPQLPDPIPGGPQITISPQPRQANGLVSWVVTCPAGEQRCAGTIQLRTVRAVTGARAVAAQKRKRRRVTLGTKRYTLKGGERQRIHVRVNKSGRRLVRKRKRVRVRATFTTRDQSGNVTRRTQDFTLREIAFRHS